MPRCPPGAGKGRQLAGLIQLFWQEEGSHRVLWLSVSPDLERVGVACTCTGGWRAVGGMHEAWMPRGA